MSCFWNGILNSLRGDWFPEKVGTHPESLLAWFQCLNPNISELQALVFWQDGTLSQKLLEEHKIWVKHYSSKDLHQGHWTSTCDPFLVLLCFATQANIEHRYRGTTIKYTCQGPGSPGTLYFSSNSGHFEFSRRDIR